MLVDIGEAAYAMTRSVSKSFSAVLISSATKAIAKQIYWVRWFRKVGNVWCGWSVKLSRENYSSGNAISDCFSNMWRPGGFPKILKISWSRLSWIIDYLWQGTVWFFLVFMSAGTPRSMLLTRPSNVSKCQMVEKQVTESSLNVTVYIVYISAATYHKELRMVYNRLASTDLY